MTRKTRKWFVGFALAMAIVVVLAAPRDRKTSGCLFCGARHEEKWWLGIKTTDRVHETECAIWVRGIYPDHSNHLWATGSMMHKSWGFGPRVVGDALGTADLETLHRFRSQLGETQARELLAKYHSTLTHDRESFIEWFRTELSRSLTGSSPTSRDAGSKDR